ncbi:prepilin-type N-terminal cleavage/methylation domain-containing protein, partial [Candidatus Kaiserbacteria bacterium]|nr:prepilin-type N-terminal cleavage/methylation domain-containing protein [Candidatus Kaiserbacteria bacterium]
LTFKRSFVKLGEFGSNMKMLFAYGRYRRRGQGPQLKSQCQGFSLVETLVAITILLLVIIGPMRISTSTARSTSFASEQVTAFFLAQEGVEIVQNTRDKSMLEQLNGDTADGWDDVMNPSSGIFTNCFSSNGCNMHFHPGAEGTLDHVDECDGGNALRECKMYISTSDVRSKFTHHTGGEETPFRRRIYLEEINDHEVQVRSVVDWRTGSIRDSQQVEVETYLFDIYGS